MPMTEISPTDFTPRCSPPPAATPARTSPWSWPPTAPWPPTPQAKPSEESTSARSKLWECFRHTFSLVSLSGHGPDASVEVEKITVNDPCPLVNIPAEGFAQWDDCLAELNAFPASRPCLLRINVLVDDFLHPEARDEAAAALEGKAATLCVINSRRADPAEGASSADDSMTVAEFRDTPPFDLAARYAADTAADFSPELMELFREIESSIE